MASNAPLNSLTEVPGNLQVQQSPNSEVNGLFYQTVSETALLQALQSTLTVEGSVTTPSLSTVVTGTSSVDSVSNGPSLTTTSTGSNSDKDGQAASSQAALMSLLGNLSATQLLMVYCNVL